MIGKLKALGASDDQIGSVLGRDAASVQLSVPLLAALGGVLWLGEPFSARLGVAAVAVLGGVAVVLNVRR